jgi:type I restriction enzyme S subunit
MSWELKRLDEVTSKIGDGLHGTPKYDLNGDYFFINGNNLNQGKILLKDDTKRIDEQEYNKIKKDLSSQTIFVAINGTIGNVAIYNDENIALGKSACYLNIKADVEKIFIRYVLEDENFQKYAQSFATGATIKNLGLKAVREYKFSLPPLQTQKRIASILSAYDDSIENNLKRIKLLEETAQNIYKEWFVHFRFPNYEHTAFYEASGLPVGWEMKIADDIYNINIGKTPPRLETQWFSREDGVKWVSIADMNKSSVFISQTNERITKDGVHKFNMRMANEGSVLLSFKLTVGAVVIASEEVVTNEAIAHFNILENSILSKEYTYCFLKSFNYQSLGSTSSIGTSINSKIVKSMKIVFPTENVISEFTQSVEGVFKQIKNLTFQNQKLKEARDILLPRLMNRAIEV